MEGRTEVESHSCVGADRGSGVTMRIVHLSPLDSRLFGEDVVAEDLEFFRKHSGAFKRMWEEQVNASTL